MHPLDSRQLALEQTAEQLKTIDVAGVACVRLVDHTPEVEYRRQWLVASRPPHQTVRYIAEAGDQGVQIDIDWEGQAESLRPSGWRYQIYHAGGGPTQYFGAAQATRWESATTPLDLELDEQRLPEGTWVVAEDARPPHSYLTRAGGQRRPVTEAELAWLPWHEELLRTESGQVIGLIQRQVFWRQLRSGQIWTANILCLLSLMLGGWWLLRRIQRFRTL